MLKLTFGDPLPDSPALPDDLKRLHSALLSDRAQVDHSLLKTELADALSPMNTTLEQVKSYYEDHDLCLCEVEDGQNDYTDRLVNVEASLDMLWKENEYLKEKMDDLENCSQRSNIRVVGIPERLRGQTQLNL